MDHRQLEEAIAAYALGALDDPERVEVERALVEHLPGCASCRQMLADFREVAGDLALLAPPERVPPEAEERILGAPLPARPAAARAASVPVRRRWSARLAVAAAAAAVAALGGWNLRLASDVREARAQARLVAGAMSLMGAPDAHSATLAGDRGGLVFVWRPGEAVLVGEDVEPPPSGRVLQLWLMRDGVPTSAAVFRPTDGVVLVRIRVDPTGFERVAVTVEPGPDGSPRPSGAPVYAGLLTA
jgi:anti-sigma-K factor RskA